MILRLAGLALLCGISVGCTVRYSQSMVGRIVRVETLAHTNEDYGIAAGAGWWNTLAVYTFKESPSLAELTTTRCNPALTAVDYRDIWAGYYLGFSFPHVTVKSYCLPRDHEEESGR
jgi:hypothetical protein